MIKKASPKICSHRNCWTFIDIAALKLRMNVKVLRDSNSTNLSSLETAECRTFFFYYFMLHVTHFLKAMLRNMSFDNNMTWEITFRTLDYKVYRTDIKIRQGMKRKGSLKFVVCGFVKNVKEVTRYIHTYLTLLLK